MWSCFPLCPSPPCLSSLTFTHTHIYTNTYFHFRRDSSRALWRICFPVSSLHSISTAIFFFLSTPLLVFASIFPGAFYYTAKVAFVSPPRLKPEAPVCQRAQLCDDKWTLTWKCDNSQRVLQKTLTSLNGNFFSCISSIHMHVQG